jgi:precorrin-6A synthase
MRVLHLIGIGAGDRDQVTVQAVKVMNTVDVFLVIDKGNPKQGLVDVRTDILREHVTREHRVVEIEDPPRDRTPTDYGNAVDDWHARRAARISDAIAAEPDDCVGAILVWGDPSLYDSTIRVVERILALGRVHFEFDVIAGVTSVSALAAEHRIVLNRVGEAVQVTTGRNLREVGLPDGVDAAVVMLDSDCSFTALPDWDIWWGANLGTSDARSVSGRVGDVAEEIEQVRAEVKSRAGWVMDTYLVRRSRLS